MTKLDEIREKLSEAFQPVELDVVDDSESHRGHGGHREGEQTHFKVRIRAAAFGPMNRLARHRAIHAALGAELIGRIHALALDVDGVASRSRPPLGDIRGTP